MVLKKQKILYVAGIIPLLLFLFSSGVTGQSPEKVEKRIGKNIALAWPGQVVSLAPVEIPPAAIPEPGEQAKCELFQLHGDDGPLGILLLASAKGRYEYFDYMVLYDNTLNIIQVDILVYRSDHGYEIMNKGWLKQFIGSKGCDLVYGRDIDALSGATLSAGALTTDIQRWCKVLGSGIR